MEPAADNTSVKLVGALIIGLLVGFIAGVFWQERRSGIVPKEDIPVTALQTVDDESAASSSSNASNLMRETKVAAKGLLVKDQPAAGLVEIENLDAQETLWVAVRETKDGSIGNILGAQKVFVGDRQKVTVELLRPTVSGGTYRIVLYKDIGAPAFNYREDTIVEGVEGNFMAQ